MAELESIDTDRLLETAVFAARRAGEILMDFYGKAEIQEKSSQNLVTEADFAAETAVRRVILQAFPEHQILGEEEGHVGGSDERSLWVVDPLDGTNNYAHGIPQFAVSIAYLFDGVPRVGVILDPTRQELFTAISGQAAYLNDKELAVSRRSELSDSIVATGFYYDRGEMMEKTLNAIHRLFGANIRGIRRLGSAALDLAWVACGRLEGFFEYQLAPWDYAAGALIIQQAGGTCLDRVGQTLTLESGSVVATNGLITQAMLDCVDWQRISRRDVGR